MQFVFGKKNHSRLTFSRFVPIFIVLEFYQAFPIHNASSIRIINKNTRKFIFKLVKKAINKNNSFSKCKSLPCKIFRSPAICNSLNGSVWSKQLFYCILFVYTFFSSSFKMLRLRSFVPVEREFRHFWSEHRQKQTMG